MPPASQAEPTISISVISHAQADLVGDLLGDPAALGRGGLDVLLTLNVPEALPQLPPGLAVQIVRNVAARVFGANHNAASRHAQGEFFCVVNPDIRINIDPFSLLVGELADARVGIAAPLVVDASGATEDSARRFPTLSSLAPRLDYAIGDGAPDWLARMFMMFRRAVFASVAGFDEHYFLYYEDVDLRRRLRRAGYDVRLVPGAPVTRLAQRESRRSLRYLRWHLASMTRYLFLDRCGRRRVRKDEDGGRQ